MSTPSRRRLVRDLKRLQQDAPHGVIATPKDNNIMLWNALIFGPDDTPFENGTFKLVMEFSEEYPNKPPKVKFLSKMYHPNVYADGSICLDILQNRFVVCLFVYLFIYYFICLFVYSLTRFQMESYLRRISYPHFNPILVRRTKPEQSSEWTGSSALQREQTRVCKTGPRNR